MFKNYITIALRNILRNKLTSTINILGLGLGMGVFILIMSFINQELKIDKFIKDKNRIYRVECGNWAVLGPGFAEKAVELSGKIEEASMLQPHAVSSDGVKQEGEVLGVTDYIAVSKNFIQFFGLEIVLGDSQNPLSLTNALVLTQSEAERIYGNLNPIGKTLTFYDKYEMQITAVIKDPVDFHFTFKAMFLFDQYLVFNNLKNYQNLLLSNKKKLRKYYPKKFISLLILTPNLSLLFGPWLIYIFMGYFPSKGQFAMEI